jgi:hypothetical protein
MMENGRDYEIAATVTDEAGYRSALEGLALNKNQPPEEMPAVARRLCQLDGGHNKFLEQIHIWVRVRAPRYWWQEADTYRLSSKQSQSTMHTIMRREITRGDFELGDVSLDTREQLNFLSDIGLKLAIKRTLPEGYMQTRMWQMSYKTLRNIILQRRRHELPHWQGFIGSVLSQVQHPELLPGIDEHDKDRRRTGKENTMEKQHIVVNSQIEKMLDGLTTDERANVLETATDLAASKLWRKKHKIDVDIYAPGNETTRGEVEYEAVRYALEWSR